MTFAPKDVTPIDFTPKVGVQGLGYRGLDPGLALQGRGTREHINLFDPQLDARSQLFGGPEADGRRRGVAGQVVFLRPAFSLWVWARLCQQDTTFYLSPAGVWRWSSGGRGRRHLPQRVHVQVRHGARRGGARRRPVRLDGSGDVQEERCHCLTDPPSPLPPA